MTLASTSKTAYDSIVDKLGDRQEQVFEAIKSMKQATNEQLSDYLHLPIQSITGRVNELNRYGLVEPVGIERTKSGRPAKLWSVKYKTINFSQTEMFANECAE